MIFKDGVDPDALTAEGMHIAEVADALHQEWLGQDVVITETNTSKHRVERSAHYRGDAVDIRIWYTEADSRGTEAFAAALRENLGPDYVVIVEHNHIHAHWGPIWHGLA